MSDLIHVATRKGLFNVVRSAGGTWSVEHGSFLGDNCPMVLHDPRTGMLHAALDHGHFGGKMQRSSDGGATWQAANLRFFVTLRSRSINSAFTSPGGKPCARSRAARSAYPRQSPT